MRRGEKVAIVGRTGSGKTSVLNLLLRLNDCQRGEVRVWGRDVRAWELKNLRDSVTVVPQLGFVFSDTVSANIDPEGKLDKETL